MPVAKQKALDDGDKIIDIITNHGKIQFASALRNELKVMSAENSLYFTCSDLAQHVKDKYLKPYPNLCEPAALKLFTNRMSIALSGMFKERDHGHNALRRTPSKIAHTNPNSFGQKSIGYRFGNAMGAATVDADSINGQVAHEQQFAQLMGGENLLDGLIKAIKTLDFADLVLIGNTVNGRMRAKYNSIEARLTEATSGREEKLRRELEELQRLKR